MRYVDPGGRVRRFELHRDEDVSGVSGTGVVAQGCVFDDDVAVVEWLGGFPTSVCWHQRGMESIIAVHGHGGRSRIVWLDPEEPIPPTSQPPTLDHFG